MDKLINYQPIELGEKDKENVKPSSSQNLSKSPCPVCQVSVPTNNLQRHMENCKKPIQRRQSLEKRKPPALPKMVYNLLKDSDLKKKCKEFGLNAKGERRLLISRLQKYTLLYNTEILLDHPKSPLLISMQVDREEKEERAGKVDRPDILQYDRNTDKEVIEAKQKSYLLENKSNFADLVKKGRDQKLKRIEGSISSVSLDLEVAAADVDNGENISASDTKDETALSENHHTAPTIPAVDETVDAIPHNEVSLKRKMSPCKVERPSKKSKSINRKSKVSTPMKTGNSSTPSKPSSSKNIFTKLTQSAEQRKAIPKLECPVCGLAVAEKFLNIHLDKCLKSGEESRTASQRVKKKTTIKNHMPKVEDETTDEENEEDFSCFSQINDNDASLFTSTLPGREKHARTVVRAPIVESSQSGTVEPLSMVDTTFSPPSSPLLDRYTETISQSQGRDGARVPGVPASNSADRDMFASDSEEVDAVSTVSSNLLDIDEKIDDMMEAALLQDNPLAPVSQSSSVSSSSSQPQRRSRRKAAEGTKHVTVSVVPKIKNSKPSTSKAGGSTNKSGIENSGCDNETNVKSTRRRIKK